MSDLKKAAQQALEALEERYVGALRDKAMDALKAALAEEALQRLTDANQEIEAALEQPTRAQRQRDAGYTRRPTLREISALEQPEQEPVSTWYGTDWPAHMQLMAQLAHLEPGTDLYTHPPRREWRGLSPGELQSVMATHFGGHEITDDEASSAEAFARAIEAALKERNA